MKYSFCILLLAVSMFYGCMHSSQTQPNVITLRTPFPSRTSSVWSAMTGSRTWHGIHQFDGFTDTITGDVAAITVINDTSIMVPFFSYPLTYYYTDSINKCAVFVFKWAPPTLCYYYTRDSLHYTNYAGGIHNELLDLSTL